MTSGEQGSVSGTIPRFQLRFQFHPPRPETGTRDYRLSVSLSRDIQDFSTPGTVDSMASHQHLPAPGEIMEDLKSCATMSLSHRPGTMSEVHLHKPGKLNGTQCSCRLQADILVMTTSQRRIGLGGVAVRCRKWQQITQPSESHQSLQHRIASAHAANSTSEQVTETQCVFDRRPFLSLLSSSSRALICR